MSTDQARRRLSRADRRLGTLRGAFIPVALALAIALWLLTPSHRAKPIHGPCLVHRDCHASERCLVIPKADGFASEGECVDPCGDDLQCPAQQRCEPFAENGSHLSPASAADAGACRAGARR